MARMASDNPVQFSLFVSNFGSLVERGFKPVEAMRALNKSYGRMKSTLLSEAIEDIVTSVEDGMSLAEAFRETNYFPEDFVSMLASGEKSGSLALVMKQYLKYLNTYQTANKAFRSAMTYPLVMLSAIVVAIFGFAGFLVPSALEPMLMKSRKTVSQLNASGQFLFMLSSIVSFAGPVGTVLMIIGSLYWIWKPGRPHIEKIFFLIPSMRNLFFRLSWATFLKSLSMCLVSGLTLYESLEACQNQSPKDIYDAYDEILDEVKSGESLSGQFDKNGVDALITLSVDSGEQSGQLAVMADSIAEQYVSGMEQEIKQASSSLEPILIVVLAAVGGGLAGTLMMTIMSLTR